MAQTYPLPITAAMVTPEYLGDVSYNWPYNGLSGDDVNVATANATGPYEPKNQGNKADILGVNMAVDITSPRGWVDPLEPYGPAPTPTVTSLNPTSRVVAPTDDVVLHVIGTNFLKGSIIYFGASSDGERTTYVSPTELTTVLRGDLFTGVDPAVPVKVSNAGKMSNIVNFAFTAA